jgi:type II secretory pathway component PulF
LTKAVATNFYYRAVGPEGGIVEGRLLAVDASGAADSLLAKGHRPLRVQTKPLSAGGWNREISFAGARRMGLRDMQSFCRELATLLGAGLELHRASQMLASAAAARSRMAGFAGALAQGLSLGRTLAESIADSGYRVPADLVPVVRSAEMSGTLAAALQMLATSYAQSLTLRSAMTSASLYPVFLLLVAGAALAIISVFVAPNLVALFVSLERPVPLVLDIVAQLPALIQRHAVVLVLAVLALLLAARSSRFKGAMRALAFRLPVLGSMFLWSATSRFASLLSLSVVSNVPLAQAMRSAWATAAFPGADRQADKLAEAVRRGDKPSDAIARMGSFPERARQLLAIGEATNRLPEMLAAIVADAQEHVAQRVAVLTNLMAPVLIVLVGSLLGALIFSVFSALLEISQIAP